MSTHRINFSCLCEQTRNSEKSEAYCTKKYRHPQLKNSSCLQTLQCTIPSLLDCELLLWTAPNLAIVHKFEWPKNLFYVTNKCIEQVTLPMKNVLVATRKKQKFILLILLLFCFDDNSMCLAKIARLWSSLTICSY